MGLSLGLQPGPRPDRSTPEEDDVNANWRRNGLVYLLIVVAVVALFYRASQSAVRPTEIDLTQVASLVQSGKVTSITVMGDQLQVQRTDDKEIYVSHKEP